MDQATRRRVVLLAIGLTVAALGHTAWWLDVDTSPGPFLPEEAAQAKVDVARAFPNVTQPTVRVLMVTEEGGNVLSPDALTTLAGLRNRISSDPTVAPQLARTAPLASVLTTLDPHLDGPPGQWGAATVEAAVENATATPQGRRTLAAFLGTDATVEEGRARSDATALVVQLSGTDDPDATRAAQQRIRTLAQGISVTGLTLATDAPALEDEAARSIRGLWTPIGALVLVPLGALVARARLRRLPAWVVTLLAGAGGGLLAAWSLGHATPASLVTAYLGTGLGLATLAAHGDQPLEEAPAWTLALPVLPLLALAGWAPAGIGALALATGVGAIVPIVAGALEPDALRVRPRWRVGAGSTTRQADAWAATLAGPSLVAALVLALAAAAGLPATAVGGWHGTLPEGTDAGRAAGILEDRFGGAGPGGQLAIAAWGPAEEPGFLGALDEASDRLDQLTLAATGESVESILSVARDWATNETATDPGDAYDAEFAAAWRNATDDEGVPVRGIPGLFDRLETLDPERTRAYLDTRTQGTGGVALLRQPVSVSGVVPRPSATVEAALQPLVAASDRVAEGGNALDDARAEAALHGALPGALVALLVASLAASAVHLGRTRGRPGTGLVVGLLATAPAALVVAGLDATGLALRPVTFIAAAAAIAFTLALALPATARALDAETAAPIARLARAGLPAGLVLLGVLLPLVSEPATGLRSGGLALVVGLAGAAVALPLGLPGIVQEARASGDPSGDEAAASVLDAERLPAQAHATCPVCERTTATAAERCSSCGRWNLREACPAHPDAVPATCAECGTRLHEPRFR